MRYVALLRGINVGGNNKVPMSQLKATFERAGCTQVVTYINSGNVVFSDDREPGPLTSDLEDAIETDFGKRHRVLLRRAKEIHDVIEQIPESWVNDGTMRTDVMFLWEDRASPEVLEELPAKDGIDEVVYVPGAVVWRVDADNLTRSGKSRLVGTELYGQMTVRNCNTVRKLAQLVEQPSSG